MTMTDKAYIVVNKKQELDVLNKFEKDGLKWRGNRNPTEFFPSYICLFPIVLFKGDCITWSFSVNLNIEEIVYDGRKEDNMTKKYRVTQAFMNELVKWRDDKNLDAKKEFIDTFVDGHNIQNIPDVISDWWTEPANPIENNERLIAIIKWLNGEDVFEVEAPHKFVVRSDKTNRYGDYTYIVIEDDTTATSYTLKFATEFETREEAQVWANSHQVVVEVDEDGNEAG